MSPPFGSCVSYRDRKQPPPVMEAMATYQKSKRNIPLPYQWFTMESTVVQEEIARGRNRMMPAIPMQRRGRLSHCPMLIIV